ncbi:MAG: hypothetical protein DSZ21_02285 [Tenericutes bacterium]|nr:MAG: hypothetical protein DSZ21_02285 [Mycoplasmatota bacterium]
MNHNQKDVSCYGNCDGSIEITGVENAKLPLKYQWSTGDSSNSIDNLCKGQYFVAIIDSNNCQVVDTFQISEPDEISIVIDTINDINQPFSGSISISTDTPNNYLYTWVGPCDFSSNKQDIDSLNCKGCYNLSVLDTITNCKKDTSICIKTISTNNVARAKKYIRVYPNPTRESFTIDFSIAEIEQANINIYDLAGKKIFESIKNSSVQLLKVKTENFKSGLYFIEIRLKNKIYNKKIVVIK